MTPLRAGLILAAGILADCAMFAFLVFGNIEVTSPVSASSSTSRTTDVTSFDPTLQAVIDLATSIARGTPLVPPSAAAQTPVPVALGQSFTLNGTAYTVLQMVDPEPPGFFKPPPGRRFVAVEVTQASVSAGSEYSIGYFYIRGDDGKDYGWANGNNAPVLGNGHLNPGESTHGWVTFNVPIGVKPAAIVAFPPTGKRTIIATLP